MTQEIDTGISPDVKQKIIGIIAVSIPDCKIYFYGSQARGMHYHRSDVDIDLDGGSVLDRMKAFEIQELLHAFVTPLKINVVDYVKLPEEYRKNIEGYKIVWKE